MTQSLILFLVLIAVMGTVAFVVNSMMRKRDVEQVKDLVVGKALKKKKKSKDGESKELFKSNVLTTKQRLAQTFLGKNLNQKLRDLLDQAGLDWDPARTIYLSLLMSVIGFNLFWYVVPRGQPISIVGAAVGMGLPFLYILKKRSARMSDFEEQFPDALEFVARAMRTGNAFVVSLEMLYKEFKGPLADEFQRTFEEQNLGLPLDLALERLATRVPTIDVRFFVSAVALQSRTGGNLAGLLENLSYLIRERFKLKGRIRAISAHGRISGLVLAMIPLTVALLMFLTNEEYVLFFFDDPDGKILMAVTIILQFLGFISIKKLTDLEV